ncbi:MAG TPA: hypothetical protein VJ044_02795, partial [Candidatus Hodarchaeales archaeon]|nr:hypothetical protein [Candidatus Hodarchaeales archaeon]
MSLWNFVDSSRKRDTTGEPQTENSVRLLFKDAVELFETLQRTSSTLDKEDKIRIFLEEKARIIGSEDLKFFYQVTAADFANLECDEETGVSTGLFLQAVSKAISIEVDDLKVRNR